MAPVTTSSRFTDDEAVDAALVTRRRFVRGAIAGGLAAAAIAIEAAFSGVDARRKPPVRRKPVIKSTDTGSNGSNAGGSNSGSNTSGGNNSGSSSTGSNGTGTNAGSGSNSTGSSQTGASIGGDVTGPNVVIPPTQGGNNTGTSYRCTIRGEIVDANNPANNRPAETVCTTTP